MMLSGLFDEWHSDWLIDWLIDWLTQNVVNSRSWRVSVCVCVIVERENECDNTAQQGSSQ